MSDEFVTLMSGIEWEEGDPFPQHDSDDDFGRPPGEPDDEDDEDDDDDE